MACRMSDILDSLAPHFGHIFYRRLLTHMPYWSHKPHMPHNFPGHAHSGQQIPSHWRPVEHTAFQGSIRFSNNTLGEVLKF